LDRLFVIEQWTGLVRIVKRGTVLATPFLNVASRIFQSSSERGLLGITFDPLYATNGFFYLSYTRAGDGASIIERFTVSANPDIADAASGRVAFGPIGQPFSNHNGGNIAFGPDGYLYLGLGDGGSAGDPSCNAQNPASYLGKFLRFDTSTIPFTAPPTNPFIGNSAYRPEIWSLGWRNPWRWSFDRETGELFIGDVGQNALEELDYEPAGTGGRNYGWKIMEGTNCYSTAACTAPPACNAATLTRPFHTLSTLSYLSVIGGYVYRGCNIPQLRGYYFFGDYGSGTIWSCRYNNGTISNLVSRNAEFGVTLGTISSFGEDARGEIYICSLSQGVVFKIVARDGGPGSDLGFGRVGSSGDTPLFEICGRLEAGVSADFSLRRAPASTPAVFVVSASNNPTPIFGGTLVPVPPALLVTTGTNAAGSVAFNVAGGIGAAVLYGQWVVVDVGLPEQVGFSNALRITFP
jgi:glucose/arabinose dehydrogenase